MPGHQLWKYKPGPCHFHSGEWRVRLHSPGIFKGLHILKVFFLKSLETNAQNGTLHIDYERHSSSSTMNCALIVSKVYLPGIISKSRLAHTQSGAGKSLIRQAAFSDLPNTGPFLTRS